MTTPHIRFVGAAGVAFEFFNALYQAGVASYEHEESAEALAQDFNEHCDFIRVERQAGKFVILDQNDGKDS